MSEQYPSWLKLALTFEGTKEIPGDQHNKQIQEFLKVASGGKMLPDETANCAAFVQYCLVKTGFQIPYTLSAKEMMNLGLAKWMFREILNPVPGCIVVMNRKNAKESWQGHVGFYINKGKFWIFNPTGDGQVQVDQVNVFGANQDDEAKYKWYDKSLVIAYLWPTAALTLPEIIRIEKFRGTEWTNAKMEPLPEIPNTPNIVITEIQQSKINKIQLLGYQILAELKVLGWVLIDVMKIYPATKEAGQALTELFKKGEKNNETEQSLVQLCLKVIKQLFEKIVLWLKKKGTKV